MDSSPIAVEIRDLHKAFGSHQVLRGVNLSIERGRITTIIGGSGSGKSVLIKHIIALLRPDSGQVLVDGEDITTMNETQLTKVRAKFGMLFQHSALFDSMNVAANIAFQLTEHTNLNSAEIKDIVSDKLEVLGLAGMEKKWPAELSGGMRKRVALARALVMNPSFLIYDEPTTGLDPVLGHQVDQMIADIQERYGVTSIIISHDMASTFRLAHKIAMIYDGQILVSGEPSEMTKCGVPQMEEFIRVSGVQFEAVSV
ncbi:MAG TPA: ABC transporter ATP-binding protein [Myxococcales bacterium]|nr:ABC transporter ATP-binding protein [Myxococcales bacterium]